MNEIGGYFELELPKGKEYHQNAIRLNTGRNAFEYVLCTKGYQKVYLPYYTCDVMLEPVQKMNLEVEFYSIDRTFRPIFDFSELGPNEVLVYTNYFGICDEQVAEVASKCNNLIVDNSQAFYSLPLQKVDTFYSARKFFGVPDGAYLFTDAQMKNSLDKDISFQRCEHLLGRIDSTPTEFYCSFKKNDDSLSQQPLKLMSKLTQRLLAGIEYKRIAGIRGRNFKKLHSKLKASNELGIDLSSIHVPMLYPYLVRNGKELKKLLIQNNIFVATYWPNVMEWTSPDSTEFDYAQNIVFLPVDQRYTEKDMKEVISILSNSLLNS